MLRYKYLKTVQYLVTTQYSITQLDSEIPLVAYSELHLRPMWGNHTDFPHWQNFNTFSLQRTATFVYLYVIHSSFDFHHVQDLNFAAKFCKQINNNECLWFLIRARWSTWAAFWRCTRSCWATCWSSCPRQVPGPLTSPGIRLLLPPPPTVMWRSSWGTSWRRSSIWGSIVTMSRTRFCRTCMRSNTSRYTDTHPQVLYVALTWRWPGRGLMVRLLERLFRGHVRLTWDF